MESFYRRIREFAPGARDVEGKRWVFVPYDRLNERVGPIVEQPPEQTVLVFVESSAKGNRRPYHKKKLVLLLSNMRHFALEQAERGSKVLYHFSRASYGDALLELQAAGRAPELVVNEPAERELRIDLDEAAGRGLKLQRVLDRAWLTTTQDFTEVYSSYKPGRSYVMDRFYRRMREKTGILMKGHKPLGGKYSFDAANRQPYRGEVPVPEPPHFAPDEVTREVMELIERDYGQHFGTLEGFDLPTTRHDCEAAWQFALEKLLPVFGPFEDAMRDDEAQLFHSRMSALINLGRLLPADLLHDVEEAHGAGKIPLQSAEGFIRQILGWREFMRHLHEQSDGFRRLKVPKERGRGRQGNDLYAGARPSALGAMRPLPAVYWGVKSDMHCIDTVVDEVWREGWSHHITRLMVLSNLATLCGFSPRELTDWFWFAYVDAYDWVVEPNVLGMGTYADGGMTATKPYVSGAAYINRMSNYCKSCRFNPKKAVGEDSCPFTALYWTFLERNQELLGGNHRLQMPYTTLRRKPAKELVQLRARAEEAIVYLESFEMPGY